MGEIANVLGILEDMGTNRLETGLLLRKSTLVRSLLYSVEAWSGLTDKQISRLEVVYSALLQKLIG